MGIDLGTGLGRVSRVEPEETIETTKIGEVNGQVEDCHRGSRNFGWSEACFRMGREVRLKPLS